MSSSDRLQRPRLFHLDRETPPARQDQFTPQLTFERVVSATGAPISAEEAYKSGLVDGEQRGREAALKELAPVLDELRAVARALTAARHERIEQAERDLLGIAGELAKRILHGELQQAGDVSVRMARACIAAAQDEEGVLTLHVAPADLELIRTHLPELQVDLGDRSLRIATDAALTPGNVVLETARRCYDGRPERLLDAATATLTRSTPR